MQYFLIILLKDISLKLTENVVDGVKDASTTISGKLKTESNEKALKLIRGIRLKTIQQPLLCKKY